MISSYHDLLLQRLVAVSLTLSPSNMYSLLMKADGCAPMVRYQWYCDLCSAIFDGQPNHLEWKYVNLELVTLCRYAFNASLQKLAQTSSYRPHSKAWSAEP